MCKSPKTFPNTAIFEDFDNDRAPVVQGWQMELSEQNAQKLAKQQLHIVAQVHIID